MAAKNSCCPLSGSSTTNGWWPRPLPLPRMGVAIRVLSTPTADIKPFPTGPVLAPDDHRSYFPEDQSSGPDRRWQEAPLPLPNAAHAVAAAGGGGGTAGERPMTLASFLEINPPTFQGTINPTEADDWISAVERALLAQQVPDEERKSPREAKRTREARRMYKKPKRAQPNVNRAPAPSRWRARALLSLIWKFSLEARPCDPDGAPTPPHFVTPKTRTLRARVAMAELT
ncbi:hypothetical protein PIB30_018174 [Stylosanthes scabra]|uniref:Uncharacterized protein n=1 Tax=Stylosanthes scabra TaxID=79078 RepID=A0ABU6S7B2_9FABA|nr:hypothetical protein [Stylosanthes scabra]